MIEKYIKSDTIAELVRLLIYLAIAVLASVTLSSIIDSQTIDVAEGTMTYHLENIDAELCPGDPLEYDVFLEVHELTFITEFTFLVRDLETRDIVSTVSTVTPAKLTLEPGVDNVPWQTITRDIDKVLEPGKYVAKLTAWSDGSHRSNFFKLEFEVIDCGDDAVEETR